MGEEVVVTGSDIEEINSAADNSVNTMNEKYAAIESIVNNTGLGGTAGDELRAQLEAAKQKVQQAQDKINGLKSTAVGKSDSYAETDAKLAQIASR